MYVAYTCIYVCVYKEEVGRGDRADSRLVYLNTQTHGAEGPISLAELGLTGIKKYAL